MARKKPEAYRREFEPIVLKELILDCDISQSDIARKAGISRPAANLLVNRGYFPRKAKVREVVEELVGNSRRAMDWLFDRGLKMEHIWQPLGKDLRKKSPAGSGRRAHESRRNAQAIISGDPAAITVDWEVEMLGAEAMRHFKIFKNPFIDDIQSEKDIYMSEEHRYIEAAMLDAAKHGGFLAVVGEVGCGKSVMRRRVVERLRRDGDILVIYPQIIDKGRVTASSICDAIVMDISDQRPRIKLEAKTRQVQDLLLDRSKSGYRAVLIVEEAHDLNIQTLKYLKRFYELEDGYKKLLGIILIGQTELRQRFIESTHVDMREVIRRCQVAEIRGLNGNIREYLDHKLKRVGSKADAVFDRDALEALSKRLTSKDRDGNVISHAYPLLVNNYSARAMNMAHQMGESKVTEDVVMEI